jgi:DNA mismatch repair ATPase MutS
LSYTRNLPLELPFHRHPLQEQVVDTFVPNDAHMIGGAGIGSSPTMPDDHNQWNSVLLCTGANACGKVFFFLGLVRFRTHRSSDRVST